MQRNKAALFLLVLLAFIFCGCIGIEFKPLPRSRDATNNRNAVLRCGVFGPGATDYKISWYYDDVNSRPLTNKSRSSSEQCRKRCIFPNGTMLLRNVRENQVGTYYCKAG
uniref:Ig-like domain-containing protein n=1 Tax=Ciona savignyi TaxID=51511 RepID=H2ZF85_CIOSA